MGRRKKGKAAKDRKNTLPRTSKYKNLFYCLKARARLFPHLISFHKRKVKFLKKT